MTAFEAQLEDGGRELVLGPERLAGLDVSRKVFVPAGDAFVRHLDVFENPGTFPVTVDVELDHSTRHDFLSAGTEVSATSSGDGFVETDDNFVLLDEVDGGAPLPTTVHVYAGPFARQRPSDAASLLDFTSVTSVTYRVTVPPGERVVLMHFSLLHDDEAVALAEARRLERLPAAALAGLSPDEQEDVVNFFAFPDADGDGLADEEEVLLGTDPADPDSDGDGGRDGFETRNGFDPTDASDGLADADGDGLANGREDGAGSDPHVADTDGDGLADGPEVDLHGTDPARPDSDRDGLSDGDEVLVYTTDPTLADSDGGGQPDGQEIADGTDPNDPVDDLFPLPVTLVDGDGLFWVLGTDGRPISLDLSAPHGSRSFFPSFAKARIEEGGREYVIGPFEVLGLQVRRKVFVPSDDSFLRYLEVVENPTAEPVTVLVRTNDDNLSPSETPVLTSSGDLVLDTASIRWPTTPKATSTATAFRTPPSSPRRPIRPSRTATATVSRTARRCRAPAPIRSSSTPTATPCRTSTSCASTAPIRSSSTPTAALARTTSRSRAT